MKRLLVLENGEFFVGEAFGSEIDIIGEVVFTTGMTGYQETLSDPSYCGQIVTFTYPLIGNYGINRDDFESINPSIHGMIVKEACVEPSNFRNEMTLDEFLKVKDIPGISGVDTRKLTKIIRQYGTLKGAICSIDEQPNEVVERLKHTELMRDQVAKVSTKTPYPSPGRGHRVVLVDFGMKHGILRELNQRDCDVVVVPHNFTAEDIMLLNPDGVMLSNGPGDPKDVPEAIEMIRQLLGRVPIFGICLGHQLFALASGAETEKMKFGHRGSNHPVKELATNKVSITSQNHSYTVNPDSLTNTDIEVTHVALNDGTVEGLRHKKYPAFTVQYHPEASPGPEDANGLFDQFMNMMNETKKKRGDLQCQNA
ncbi:carbamoyl phosphate synthase small subunit [Bacillus sp. FJAT-47783]|uniref:carbamoyl phosphate synthase small subunit n=1 Tax=Bacillus sp. FJAT-47783 TaxID=2922712 RepID=UPI001FAD1082|nr:carbamoyl phosphate synthase small subunit [Bacillus sp. FJAT-47783]